MALPFSTNNNRRQRLNREGFVVSTEMLLVVAIAIIGLIVAATSLRDSVVSELADVSGSVDDLSQTIVFNGSSSSSAATAGSGYNDQTDSSDAADDIAGAADRGITFAEDPTNEGGSVSGPTGGGGGGGGGSTVTQSAVSTFAFGGFTGGTATGTIGDGTVNTNFTVTSSGGAVLTNTDNNDVLFSEEPTNAGSITTTFDDPLTEVEFWVSSLANEGNPHLVGNFTVELSDGTIINNAAFSIVPDTISPSTTYGGFFNSQPADFDGLNAFSSGGNNYIADNNTGGTPGASQAAGRIQFTDPAITGAASGVGISRITFDRSGGVSGYQARFSVSGRVNQ